MAACRACDAQNPKGFRFCGACGAPLAAEHAETAQVRKVVTVLFSDVSGSTELGERVDPEAMRRAMGRYFAVARKIIERHGGTVEKFIGDAVMAVFGLPQVHEDDALRAVRAASEIRDAMERLNDELRREQGIEIALRIGVNTGEVVAGEDQTAQTLLTGDAVNTAARLEQAAAPGEILVGDATQVLIRPFTTTAQVTPLSLKGKQEKVAAHRLLVVDPVTTQVKRRLEGPMVGRQDELRQLTTVLQRVIGERRCHLFTIVGGAGVGKSRLVREFVAASASDVQVLRGRCLAYGDGITYWPIMEIVRDAAGIEPADSANEARARLLAFTAGMPDGDRVTDSVAAALGLSQQAAATADIAWGMRKLLERMAVRRPLVVIVDDIQWAEPALLDLLADVATWTKDAPLMLLCMARPDLLDEHPTWAGGVLNASTILLEPLPPQDSETLIAKLIGTGALSGSFGRRIVETAEGNPLFVEEMIGMLIDAGVLASDETSGDWRLVGDAERVKVPPTIQALLAARLDLLPRQERVLAQRGSVIGRTFERQAVAHLSPDADRAQIMEGLRGLVRHQVIGPYQPEDVYRFRHLLIRDAAYDTLPKEQRAGLHERFADWLERLAGDRVAEYEEVLGYHLEQAHDYRQALGQRDEHVATLAERAGGWLATAGQRAVRRVDVRAAVHLLRRATRLLPAEHPHYWSARVDLADALENGGDPNGSIAMLRDIIAAPQSVPDAVLAKARLYLTWTEHELERRPVPEVRRLIASQLRSLVRSGYFDTAAAAWQYMAGIYQDGLDPRRAASAYRRAARYAARGGEHEAEADMLLGLARVGALSRMPVSEAMEIVDRMLAMPELTRSQRTRANLELAYLYALHERFDGARELVTAAMSDFADRAEVDAMESAELTFGLIEFFAGNLPAAEAHMKVSREMSMREGRTEWGLFLAARLAHVLMLQGKDEEALRMAEEAMPAGAESGIWSWSEMLVGCVRARIAARRGRTQEAVTLARETVERAETRGFAEYPAIFAPALEDRAQVLIADGQLDEARQILERVLETQRIKENLAGVSRVQRALARLEQQAAAASS